MPIQAVSVVGERWEDVRVKLVLVSVGPRLLRRAKEIAGQQQGAAKGPPVLWRRAFIPVIEV